MMKDQFWYLPLSTPTSTSISIIAVVLAITSDFFFGFVISFPIFHPQTIARQATCHQKIMKMNMASSSSSLSLRQRLLQGGKSYGPFVLSDSPVVTELLAGIPGYTHIVLDMEHGPTSLPSCQRLLQAVDAANGYRSPRIEPIVRLDSPGNPAAKIKNYWIP